MRPDPPPAAVKRRRGLPARLGRLVVVLRYPIVAAWVLAAVAATVFLPTIREAQVGALGDLVPADAEAIETEQRAVELFGFPVLSRTLVVTRDPGGLSFEQQVEAVRGAVELNRGTLPALEGIAGALVTTNTLGEPPFSRESSTTAITYLYFAPEVGQTERTELARLYAGSRFDAVPGGVVGVTGAVPARVALAETIADSLPLVELATVVLVGLAVGLRFRAIGAPLVNLLAVAIAYLVSVRGMAYLGSQIGISVPSDVEPVIVVLLFGVITDYSIFYMTRFREALREGAPRQAAAEHATRELLPIVVTAGLTIVAASATLVLATLGFLQAFGPGLAIAVAVGLLVAITFLPAVLAIAGGALFWPGGRGRATGAPPPGDRASGANEGTRTRSRPIELAIRRPVLVALACLVVLVLAATGLARTDPGNPLIRGLPAGSEAKQAYRAATKGFAPGVLAPTVLLVEQPGIAAMREELAELQRLLASQRGVAEVLGPADQPLDLELGAVLSPTGDAARYVLVLNADPLGGRAVRYLERLRDRLPRLIDEAGLGDVRVGYAGDTALVAEAAEQTFDDLARIAPIIAAVVLLILVAFLRALVAPLYLLVASVLALCASLGLSTYVFQELLGYGGITYYVPFAAAVLLVSLGSDYNLLLVGRVWAEARHRPVHEAIATGGARAGPAITAAALVLAASFALLALVPIRSFRELAFVMSVGLLIDAFLVRSLLVPAVMTLAGRFSAWPSNRLFRAGAAGPVGS